MCRRLAMEQPAEEAPPAAPPAAPHPSAPAATNGTSKIIGRNVNGTMVVTSAPSNEAELQLYRVMQRASLLAYYDTLLEMGGDDVQQLCDAGEEEFLEIMALVGMASKPLHVRRLQKALQEWVTNPAIFQIPIVPNLCPSENPFLACNQRFLGMAAHPIIQRQAVMSPENNRPMYSPSPGAPENSCGSNSSAANVSPVHTQHSSSSVTKSAAIPVSQASIAPSNSSAINTTRSYSPVQIPSCPTASSGSSPSSVNCSPVQLTPSLLEVQIHRMALSAEKLCREYQLEPKPQNTKKKICKELDLVMMMPDSDPRKMEEIRKYAAIYGRFDCKRKPEKPLTLHEVSVNEAAAQICRLLPALLTRRDELFILARKVVRHSGFYYSKGHTQISSPCISRTSVSADRDLLSAGGDESEEAPAAKRGRPAARQEYEDCGIVSRSPDSASRASVAQGSWWGREGSGRSNIRSTESDDADSRGSFSNSSSPPLQDPEDIADETQETESRSQRSGRGQDSRVRIVAASGDSIIAVANPALALSPALSSRRSPKSRINNAECVSPADNR